MSEEHRGAWLERAMRDVGCGAWRLDLRSGEVWWSDGLAELLGAPEQVRDYDAFLQLVDAEDRVRLDAALRRPLGPGALVQVEVRLAMPDERWIEVRGHVCSEGGEATEILGTMVNATARHEAHVALERSHRALERSRAALEANARALGRLSRSPVWRTNDRDLAFHEITELAAETLGVERAGVWLLDDGGESLRLVDLFERSRGVHSRGAVIERAAAPTYFAAIDADRAIVADDAREDPRTRAFREGYLEPLGIFALLDAPVRSHGRVAGVVCCEHVGGPREWGPEAASFAGSLADFAALALDLAEREALEEQIRRSQRLESIGRLAGGVAHDFNNLLTAILNGAVLVKRIVGPEPGSDAETLLDDMVSSARRASGLTAQLLAFARRQPTAPRVIAPDDVVRRMEPMLDRVLGAGVTFSMSLDADAAAVRMDPSRLEQVVLNLVINANDAMPEGGELGVRTCARALDEGDALMRATSSASSSTSSSSSSGGLGLSIGSYFVLEVRDTGEGIPPDALPSIFEPFFTTKRRGSGLGLATSWGVVTQAGGHIDVETAPGEGTTFRVWLPNVDEVPTPTPVEQLAPPAIEGDETLLLVDHDSAVRRAVADGLLALGYRVLAAGTAVEALALAERAEVHALVSDLALPNMSGTELAMRLRDTRPGLPAVILAADDDMERLPNVLALAKPFTASELAALLRSLLDGVPHS
ncbi:MAG: GAF domain-containing protein [Myxococcales bacterium]|nr:GAF domain-containing protein [Myxococcales bacterium]